MIKETFETTHIEEITLNYLLELPEDYDDESSEGFPLLLFLHGMGERGDNLEMLYVNGIPKLLREGARLPFITLMPQCPDTSFWPDEYRSLKLLLDHITKTYNVDCRRIYITGLSMGGYGTYEMLTRYPDLFTAGAPICGGIGSMKARMNLPVLKDIPLWIFHGEQDDVVPVEESRQIHDYLQSIGHENLKMTLYPDLNHDSWTRTYDNSEVYDFLLRFRK
ncbi:prolyl oligopeptidase family serine peptidase [Proteiniclasticum sp. SCR006]|uniref:Prolyl oligopeptidase family serine peptidase n=1 Tax=Proteiniclasticum aestuarii TaxID=2817862 RepID=A0A939H7P3_9CLOT|nr:prolyl oligopeptidase family serine peptidase [Proteiniclasticum aestuarii]MBO1264004.1 prolyl oligopeptidase family serine peptidase [Proteiniclasticum aestuarii]